MTGTVFVVNMEEDSLSTAIIDRNGRILARHSEAVDSACRDQIAGLFRRMSADGSFRPKAAGIAMRPEAGMGRGRRAARIDVPTVIESGRNASVLGEVWRGAARGKSDVVVLEAGNRVTAGIMTGGRLLLGANGFSGSAAWMVVSEGDGFEVRKYGGLESVASAPAIVRAARNAVEAGFGGDLADYDPEAFTAEDIAELARRGNLACRQIYRRVGRFLGLAVANLISLFDPQIVIVTGGLTSTADLFWSELTETALSRCRPSAARRVRLRLSTTGDDAKLFGMAYLAWQTIRARAAGLKSLPAGNKPRRKPRVVRN